MTANPSPNPQGSQPSSQNQPQPPPQPEENPAPPQQEEALRQEVEKFRDLALRAQADLDNFRKRMAREKEEALRFANAQFLERLLPILDSFELGLQAARKAQGAEAILQGFSLVEKLLKDFLRDCGVQPVGSAGELFDPNIHDAVSHESHAEVPEGHVSAIMRRGYKLHERLLRPASVIVSKGPPPSQDPATPPAAQAQTAQPHTETHPAGRKTQSRHPGKHPQQSGNDPSRSSGLSTHA